jgi:hypothetical protein
MLAFDHKPTGTTTKQEFDIDELNGGPRMDAETPFTMECASYSLRNSAEAKLNSRAIGDKLGCDQRWLDRSPPAGRAGSSIGGAAAGTSTSIASGSIAVSHSSTAVPG